MRKCDWCKKTILVKELFAVNALSKIIEIFVQKIIQAAKRVRSAGKIYFADCGIRTIDTGIKHGTVTVDMEEDGAYEVTTFRIDREYSDHRHPDNVLFTDNIFQDLSRRDFTINAMAYNQNGLIDPFNGYEDLKNGVISCVGNPDDRFQEDSLRILRAMRFASVYGFQIDEKTSLLSTRIRTY